MARSRGQAFLSVTRDAKSTMKIREVIRMLEDDGCEQGRPEGQPSPVQASDQEGSRHRGWEALLSPPATDEDLHRALDGMTQSNPHWRATKPQPIEKASISFGPAPDSHVVYASPRARVVWRPHDFSSATPRRTLSIFHKDLVLTSLQIESLAKFLEKTSELVGQDLQAAHRDCARVAHQLVGRLYGGVTRVPPHSLRRQIDDNGYAMPINAVRAFFGEPELTAKP
jgi:hypothetical protein